MFKKIFLLLIIAVLGIQVFSCCNNEEDIPEEDIPEEVISNDMLNIDKYMSTLPASKIKHLREQTDLLHHPLKDAIELYGDDFEFSWEGYDVTLKFKNAKCSFMAYAGDEFEHYDSQNNYISFNDRNVMEFLSYAVIQKITFDGEGKKLTDGIEIGMTIEQISDELGVSGIEYNKDNTLVNKEYEEDGRRVEVYYIFGTVLDCDSFVVFRDGKLTSVEISTDTIYKTSKKSNAENGKTVLQKAFSFVAENNLAEFDIADLAYKGEIYSPFYDSWFYGWKFENGKYAGHAINVEKKAPHRVYIARSAESQPILFWCNGEYVDPVLSFLGKWRSSKTNEYIDIKSISKEGIVVFDLLVQADMYSEKTVLLENLSTEINEMPKSLDDCIFYEYVDEALIGDMQVFNGDVQSGYYVYAGDKSYLIDSLIMDYNGYVEYLPRGLTGRVGTGMLAFHIPESEYEYTQPSTFGYMENFGRDDPNEDSIIKNKAPSGESVINDYLNKEYETTGLKYADLEYTYLYDYAFAVNDRVYGVWESKDEHDPHYLYADSEDGVLIKECSRSLISRHTKELIYKSGTRVSGRTYAYQKYVTFDGKIVIDFEKRLITNNDSFVKEIEISNVGIDFVDKNERFMFFSDIGDRFMLNGYVLFDHTTWGATLHITDSNIPGFEIGIHYLNSETFFLDPSIGVVSMPENSEDDKYIDDKLSGTETETKLVIREFGGKIIGYVYVDENGKKTVKEFSGKILGYYYPDRDVTTDFYGKIIARGDASSALLFNK